MVTFNLIGHHYEKLLGFNRFVPGFDCDRTKPVPETTSPVATETDSLQRVVDDLSQQLRHQKNEELDRKIWKNRSKYFNLGYVKQSLVFKDFGDEKLKNDFGVSISWGKTYFTCTKNRCSEC